MDLELLRERASIIRDVRLFFEQRNYLETDTPLLAPDLIPESCLEVFETLLLPPIGSRLPKKPYWLIPSPEIWMKRLIAQHRTNIFQICKCFRNGESSGRWHNSEFTMLEYYTMEADYMDSLALTGELFGFLLSGMKRRSTKGADALDGLSPPFIRLTVKEAFKRWAGFDLYKASASPDAMEKEAVSLGLNPPSGLSVHELYDLIFIHTVEPQLKLERPVALVDYPAFVPCLAKKSPDGKTAERWELYARGTELANCYTEETSPGEVRRFFESERAEKEKKALVRHRVDEDYWKIFASGDTGPAENPPSERKKFPACSGVAMGLDRLIMVLCGRATLDGVLPFPQ